METEGQKFYRDGKQLRVDMPVYLTHEEGEVGDYAPSIKNCRHAVLRLRNKGNGYVVYDRLLCRIVDGVYYGDRAKENALEVAQYYNESESARQDGSPNGAALGLLYPVVRLEKSLRTR